MRLAIMQPYFFPYIGYFQLMASVDKWIVFDNIQFIDKGWINRNRVLHPNIEKEWMYITIPLDKRGQFDNICEINIKQNQEWKQKIIGQLGSYKRKAPYYSQTIDFIVDCFDTDEVGLSPFLYKTIKKTAEHIGLTTEISLQTEMSLDLDGIKHAGQWALRISEKMGASEYINPYGGEGIFKKHEFDEAKIKLSFMKPILNTYIQRRGGFVPGLSIVDVLMWNDIADVRNMMETGEFV